MAKRTRRQQIIADASIAATADNKTIVYVQEQTGEVEVEHDQLLQAGSTHAHKTLILCKEEKSLLLNLFEDELQFRIITVYDVKTDREYYVDVVITAWLKKMQNIEDVKYLFYSSMNGTQSDIANFGEVFCKEQAYHDVPGEGDKKIETTTFVRFFTDTPAQIVERSIKQMNHIMKCLDLVSDNVVFLIPDNYENSIKTAEDMKGSKAVALNNGYVYIR